MDNKKSLSDFSSIFKLNPALKSEINEAKLAAGSNSNTNGMQKSSSLGNFFNSFYNNNFHHLNDSTLDLSSDNEDEGLTMPRKSKNTISNKNTLDLNSKLTLPQSNTTSNLLENTNEPFYKRLFKPDSNFMNDKKFNLTAPSSH